MAFGGAAGGEMGVAFEPGNVVEELATSDKAVEVTFERALAGGN